MRKIIDVIKVIAATPATVFIGGETGTGKELVARAIHMSSLRKYHSYIKVDCTALPETLLESELFGYMKGAFTDARYDKPGKFEMADGGTVFLDEIGEIPLGVQAKLLRVLEEHSFEPLGGTSTIHVDVRIISATNRDLAHATEQGKFRKDLYYRLNIYPIVIPPLRERPEDIPVLIDYFIGLLVKSYNRKIRGVDSATLNQLIAYAWPGNVRQLHHAIEYAFINSDGGLIKPEHLPPDIKSGIEEESTTGMVKEFFLRDAEKESIARALQRNRFNRIKTARELRISRITLWRKMKKHRII
jgi:transcriptional regulator with PAS, ATPase and Fis domain